MSIIPSYVLNHLNSSNLAQQTIINYIAHLKKYIKNNWDNEGVFNISIIEFYLETIPIKSKEGFLLALLHYYDAWYEHNRNNIRQLLRTAKDDSLILSIKELHTNKNEKILFEEVINLAKKKQKNHINTLIAQLYTLEVPFRADTWSRVRIIDVEEPNTCNDYNYLNLDTGMLYLNRYKTIKCYGKKTILLNEELLQFIKKWWNENAMYIGNICKFLIPSRDGNRLSAHNFNLRLKTIFGYGSRALRHSYVSYKHRIGTDENEMKKIAYRMNTSYMHTCITYDDTNAIIPHGESDSE